MEEILEVSRWNLLVRKSAVTADLAFLLGSEDLLPQPVIQKTENQLGK